MRARRKAKLAGIALGYATASCAAILGFEHLSSETEGTHEEASNDQETPSEQTENECNDLGLPPLPSADDPSDGDVPPILGALRTLDLGVDVDGGRPEIPGFNLDLRCSVDPASSSCTTNLKDYEFATHAKDKNDSGLDNVGFSIMEYISRHSDVLNTERIDQGVRDGLYGAVIRIEDWNGQANDGKIRMDIFPAIGFNRPDGGSAKPTLEEDDLWVLDQEFRVARLLDASVFAATTAWITDYQVAARFTKLTLPIFIHDDPKPFVIRLTDVVLSAKLTKGPSGHYELHDGVFSGRWKSSEFLGEVRTIYLKDSNGLKNTSLCDKSEGATLIYTSVKDVICNARDLRSDGKDNEDLPCDALSTTARISTYYVKELGTFATRYDGGVRCDDPAIPLGDDCPPIP